jgi:hypothetical protein
MKLLRNIPLLLALAAVVLVSSCKPGDDPDPFEKVQLGKFAKTWTISSASLDNVDRDDFSTISLVLAGTFNASSPAGPYQYTVNGTRPNPSPWPASGSWSFAQGEGAKTTIIRDSGTSEVQMSYVLSADAKTLTLNFTVAGTGFQGSRTNEVEGNWEFVFTTN